MQNNKPLNRFEHYRQAGHAGTAVDVDLLMDALVQNSSIATTKLVDYALGLVNTPIGRDRIRDYLWNGSPIQRNYAALYFKRRGDDLLVEEAFLGGKIDLDQGFSV